MNSIIEVHVLQWFPLSCINRDDAGLPKSMPLGGQRRARWSSQSQKYALRKAFSNSLDAENLCMKTRRLPIMGLEALVAQGYDESESAERIVAAMYALGLSMNGIKKAGDRKSDDADPVEAQVEEPEEDVPAFGPGLTGRTQVILPVHQQAHNALAAAVVAHWDDLGGHVDLSKAEVGKTSVPAKVAKVVTPLLSTVLDVSRLADVSLFGRMLTEVPNGNVDAACSVSHAFTTHPDDYVTEFWSAVDDDASSQGHGGSANMNTQGLTSGCFYRYGVVDLNTLSTGPLADDPALVQHAVEAFVREFSRLRPRAMVHGTAPYVDPGLVMVRVGNQTRMLGDAFVRPVEGDDYLTDSSERLSEVMERHNAVFGDEAQVFSLAVHPDVAESPALSLGTSVESMEDLVRQSVGAAFDG